VSSQRSWSGAYIDVPEGCAEIIFLFTCATAMDAGLALYYVWLSN